VASVVVSRGGEVFDDGVAGLETPGDVGAWRGIDEEERGAVVAVADVLESVVRTRSASWTRWAPPAVNCSASQRWRTVAVS
jgi:hypothetical protein